jgi:hypothetical protein
MQQVQNNFYPKPIISAVRFIRLFLYQYLFLMQTLVTKRNVYSVTHIDSSYTDCPGVGTKLFQISVNTNKNFVTSQSILHSFLTFHPDHARRSQQT